MHDKKSIIDQYMKLKIRLMSARMHEQEPATQRAGLKLKQQIIQMERGLAQIAKDMTHDQRKTVGLTYENKEPESTMGR